MPQAARSSDMPPLFVLGTGGKAELVNYRVRDSYYIVDRLFEAAELRLGTRPQTKVRITKAAEKPKSRRTGG
jgi:type IV secretion system protein TrbG